MYSTSPVAPTINKAVPIKIDTIGVSPQNIYVSGGSGNMRFQVYTEKTITPPPAQKNKLCVNSYTLFSGDNQVNRPTNDMNVPIKI